MRRILTARTVHEVRTAATTGLLAQEDAQSMIPVELLLWGIEKELEGGSNALQAGPLFASHVHASNKQTSRVRETVTASLRSDPA
jgi:hypothetical protein